MNRVLMNRVWRIVAVGFGFGPMVMAGNGERPIRVVGGMQIKVETVPAERTPLGIANDYKPWIAQLKSGQLLIVGFCYGGVPNNELKKGEPYIERAVFWRSDDSGQNWRPREERMDIHGREFSVTVLSDGTLLMPCHILKQDKFNTEGYSYSKLFRSTDEGRTWSEIPIGPEHFPSAGGANTDRTAIEMADPEDASKRIVSFGVSRGGFAEHVYLWRSRDFGATWDRTLSPETGGWDDVDGFFGQSSTYRAASGKWFHVVRVDRTGKYWKMSKGDLNQEAGDQGDRMMAWTSADEGATWKRYRGHGDFGTYGEMYPRFLRLRDGRLLLTFTVRSNSTDGYALGLRAIVSADDGVTWDFKHDRLVLEYDNVGASGGSYGNTIQLDDGTLVTTYSYRKADNKTTIEAMRWRLPEYSR